MTRSVLRAAIGAALIGLSGSLAIAGPITQQASAAETAAEAGDFASAFDRMNAAYDLLWQASPLFVAKALFIEGSQGYGLYTERADGSAFPPGEQMVAYIEPVGFGYGSSGTGSYVLGFDIDVTLLKSSGELVFAREDFASITRPLRYRNREFFMTLNLNFNGLPAGDYQLELTLHDQNSDKSVPVTMPFSILDQT